MNTAIGPLFAGPPGAHGIPWLHVLPIIVAVPAAALLLWGLLRGRLAPEVGVLAVALPIVVYGLCARSISTPASAATPTRRTKCARCFVDVASRSG